MAVCGRGGRPARPGRGAGAFTILEILLAIAIIALIGSVLIGGSLHLLSEEPATLEQVFWKSVQDARKQALKAEHEMLLKFDAQKKQFVILDGLAPATLAADGITKEEVALKHFPIPPASAKDLTIDLLSANKSGAMVLIGGVLQESRSLPFVTFYPDGTCSPFRLQIAGSAGAYTLDVDPWTCAAILKPGESNSLGNP